MEVLQLPLSRNQKDVSLNVTMDQLGGYYQSWYGVAVEVFTLDGEEPSSNPLFGCKTY